MRRIYFMNIFIIFSLVGLIVCVTVLLPIAHCTVHTHIIIEYFEGKGNFMLASFAPIYSFNRMRIRIKYEKIVSEANNSLIAP